MARSIDLWGFRVDLGPHRFFSKDPEVNALWLEMAGADHHLVDRLTRIYYRDDFYEYPIRGFASLRRLGLVEAGRCLASYGRARLHRGDDSASFETWVVHQFGRRLFEIFFKSYSEKLWGMPCTELDVDFARQRIKRLSLREVIVDMFRRRDTSSVHRSLIDRFPYPNGGTGMIYERMAAGVEARNGRVFLNTQIRHIEFEGNRAIGLRLADGTLRRYDAVISTMPLTLLAKQLPSLTAGEQRAIDSLTFRSTILVYLHIDAADLFADNWIYVHAPELAVGRITNFNNWGPGLNAGARTTAIAMEYWCNEDEVGLLADADLIARATRELAATSFARGATVIGGHVVRIPRCYPVYRRGYKRELDTIIGAFRRVEGLHVIGRYGAFKYNNQDHSMLMGLRAAQNVLGRNPPHDLWSINADDGEYHEENLVSAPLFD